MEEEKCTKYQVLHYHLFVKASTQYAVTIGEVHTLPSNRDCFSSRFGFKSYGIKWNRSFHRIIVNHRFLCSH